MVTITPSGDTYVDKTPGNENTNYSSSTLLYISKKRYAWDGRKRVLIQFDISGLGGVTITSATIGVYWEFADVASRGKPLTVHRTTSSWNPSTVTYNTQPTYTGGGPVMYLGNWAWGTSDVKSQLQDAIDASESTFGVIIIFQNEDETNDHFGKARSVETSSDPYIILEYAPSTYEISGNVKDSDGNNLNNVTITLKDGTDYSTNTDIHGNYTQSVNPDTYTVTAYKHGYPQESASVDASSSNQVKNFILRCIPRTPSDRRPIPVPREIVAHGARQQSPIRSKGNLC